MYDIILWAIFARDAAGNITFDAAEIKLQY
jgi:hypothetical protein